MASTSRIYLAILLMMFALPVLGQSEEESLARAYGGEDFVSIATGRRQPIVLAPAVASVITAADIDAIGATDLDEVLETVPGLHVARSVIALNPVYVVRGIFSSFNPQVLVLINGIPITNLFQGDRNQVWGGMPVNDIARIEIIRGPGSAIYGADAFAGVINIITKTADDIAGTEVGARAGSFDTKDAWLLHGGRWSGTDVALSLEFHETEGDNEIIESDAQRVFDALFGTKASLAPGPLNAQQSGLDARLDLARGNWRLRLGYQGRRRVETGAGVAQALDPQGHGESDRINADLTYHLPTFSDKWDVTTQFSYLDTTAVTRLRLFPPGASFPEGVFPQGVIGNPDVFERHARADLSAFYSGFLKHRLRFGAGFNHGSLYKVRETRNYTLDPKGLPAPLGSIIDVSETAPFLRPHDRENYYAFIQDEWALARDWSLTSGVRYDHYSDFGSTVNPRLALVWQTRYNLATKILYGRAFRAPSFAEEFNINNPVALGNPNLKPETINTIELAFDYQPISDLRMGLNIFRYEIDNLIRFVPDPTPATSFTARNIGKQRGYGLEWEASWRLSDSLRLYGNYAFQHSTDETTDSDAGNAPHHQIYARAEWRFRPEWLLTPEVIWIADRKRVAGDPRPDIPDYEIVDVALRRKNILGHWEAALIVHNLFDADAREPSPAPGLIPNDLPLPGRSVFAELRYRF